MKISTLKEATQSFEKEYIQNTYELCGKDIEKTCSALGLSLPDFYIKVCDLDMGYLRSVSSNHRKKNSHVF